MVVFGNDTKKLYAGVFHSRLNLVKACCLLVQTFLFARWLSQSMKIKLYRTIIFPVVLCGCETCCLTLEEHKLRVQHFNFQLMHTTLKPHTVHGTHTSQVTICSHNTDVLYELYLSTFNQVCNLAKY